MEHSQSKQRARKSMEHFIISNSDLYDSVTLSTLTEERVREIYNMKKEQQDRF